MEAPAAQAEAAPAANAAAARNSMHRPAGKATKTANQSSPRLRRGEFFAPISILDNIQPPLHSIARYSAAPSPQCSVSGIATQRVRFSAISNVQNLQAA